eukprot:GEMP01009804.1.p1 GENE.GEMP01009804.1~~GEMP01009804.1.p1  ORF type:complete len:316 (-),score=66.18 GEMP01009804.1:2322-3269(-)
MGQTVCRSCGEVDVETGRLTKTFSSINLPVTRDDPMHKGATSGRCFENQGDTIPAHESPIYCEFSSAEVVEPAKPARIYASQPLQFPNNTSPYANLCEKQRPIVRHFSAPSIPSSNHLCITDGTSVQLDWEKKSEEKLIKEGKKEKKRRKKEERQRKEDEAQERKLREEREVKEAKRSHKEYKHRLREEENAARERMIEYEKSVIEKKNEAGRKLNAFLTKHEFRGINSKRKPMKWGKYCYPLHKAVELNDAEIVELLLDFGADRSVLSSSRKTPLDKAHKITKDGSHRKIIETLSDLSLAKDQDNYLTGPYRAT